MLLGSRCTACLHPGRLLCPVCADDLKPPGIVPAPAPLAGVIALFAYESAGRRIVVNLKFRNHRRLVTQLAEALASLAPVGVDVVTWAPTSADRRRRRGFDQAQLLARAVARALQRPCRPLLRRGPGGPQTGRSQAERCAGPRFDAAPVHGSTVLVVDDVVTTGATLGAAARALTDAGAAMVLGAALAATPARHDA